MQCSALMQKLEPEICNLFSFFRSFVQKTQTTLPYPSSPTIDVTKCRASCLRNGVGDGLLQLIASGGLLGTGHCVPLWQKDLKRDLRFCYEPLRTLERKPANFCIV